VPSPTLLTAWNEFYEVYSDAVRRVFAAQAVADAEAKEYVREVWAAVAAELLNLEKSPQDMGFRAWLLRSLQRSTNKLLLRKASEEPEERESSQSDA
jgi:DNA-directed RNA polymerase specialized sigma24 family protein